MTRMIGHPMTFRTSHPPTRAAPQLPCSPTCCPAQESPEVALLPRILELWQDLHVPLAYRSRFLIAFRGRESFYYNLELRRLEWKVEKEQAVAAATATRSRELDRAARALDVSRERLIFRLSSSSFPQGYRGSHCMRAWLKLGSISRDRLRTAACTPRPRTPLLVPRL